MKVILGSAPDSWGVWFTADAHQTPWSRFLDEVATAGYRWIELGPPGYLPTDATILQSELERRSLRVSGTFVMFPFEAEGAWERWGAEVERTCALLATLGSQYLLLIDDVYTDLFTGEALDKAELSDASWLRFLDTTSKIADVAQQHRLRPVFHPHAETHIEYEPQIERLLREGDSRIGICLDVGHHSYRGGDPLTFIRRHHSRIWYLHLKSVDRAVRQQVEAEGIPFAKAVASGMFVEPSEGAVDFEALRDVLREVEFEGFGIVEQDMYPAPFEKPLPIAMRSHSYLQGLGFG